MARKFKVGDKVRVIKKYGGDSFDGGFNIRSKGTVIEYQPEYRSRYPYSVRNSRCGTVGDFNAKELELVKSKGAKT